MEQHQDLLDLEFMVMGVVILNVMDAVDRLVGVGVVTQCILGED